LRIWQHVSERLAESINTFDLNPKSKADLFVGANPNPAFTPGPGVE